MSKFVEALQFYADAWKSKSNKLYGGLEWSPTEALLDDCGNRAKEAIAALSAKPTEPTMVTDAQFVAGMRRAAEIAQTRVTTSFDDCERGGADPSTGVYECSLDSRGRDCLCVEHQEEADAIARAILAEAALAALEATP